MSTTTKTSSKASMKAWGRVIIGSMIGVILAYVVMTAFLQKPIDDAISKIK